MVLKGIKIFPYGEFKVSLFVENEELWRENFIQLQGYNPLNDDFNSAVFNIKGVTGIKEYNGYAADVVLPNGYEDMCFFNGFLKEESASLKKYLIIRIKKDLKINILRSFFYRL